MYLRNIIIIIIVMMNIYIACNHFGLSAYLSSTSNSMRLACLFRFYTRIFDVSFRRFWCHFAGLLVAAPCRHALLSLFLITNWRRVFFAGNVPHITLGPYRFTHTHTIRNNKTNHFSWEGGGGVSCDVARGSLNEWMHMKNAI